MNTKINVTLTDDICFKYIFSKEEILKDFLNSFFEYIGKEERIRGLKTSTEKEMFGKKYKNKIFTAIFLLILIQERLFQLRCIKNFKKKNLIKVYHI